MRNEILLRLFKGFVENGGDDGKKPLMPFKNIPENQLLTLDDANKCDSFGGVLKDSMIFVDFDTQKEADIALKIIEDKQFNCVVFKTRRGIHAYFNNLEYGRPFVDTQKTKCMVGCGLEADMKMGTRNCQGVLKTLGNEREIIYEKNNNGVYDNLPKCFFPVKSKRDIDFLGLGAGDGRNQTFYNYILTLTGAGFSKDETRECIKIINDYVVPQPLPTDELDVVLRDDSFLLPAFFSSKGKFLFDVFATYLKNTYHIIKINNQLHIYRDGVYEPGYKVIEAEMIKHIPNLTHSRRLEVLRYLDLLCLENSKPSPANFIAFENGIYDISSDDDLLLPFSPDYVITNKIHFNYNPNAYSELLDSVLDKLCCNDDDISMLLEEVAGYVMYRRNELRKAFIMIGDKANGKSTYLDMIKTLLGDRNTTALDLSELGDRFKTAELFGKLACIGDDIGDEFIPNPAIFKKLVSGDRVTAERKGQDPFDFNSYAKLLFSANNIPRIRDKTGAVISRLVIIPFNATFSKDDPDFDPYIKYKLRDKAVIEYLIYLGIEGLKRVLKNNGFTICKKVQDELNEYEISNNPTLLFLKDLEAVVNENTNNVYRKYTRFCVENGFSPVAKIEFSKQVKKYFGVEIENRRIKGERIKVYVKRED